jgi:hypothetical protein
MYLLDSERVPKTNVLEYKASVCLAITINMALRKRELMGWYKQLSFQSKGQFQDAFKRQLGFQIVSEFRSKHCSCDGHTAQIYFRLLYDVWTTLYQDSLDAVTRDACPFLLYGDQFETNNHYLLSEPNKVTNEDIVYFATRCLKTAIFVGTTYGIKNFYKTKPFGVADVCSVGKVTDFAKKGTRIISRFFHQNFRTDAYPDYIFPDRDPIDNTPDASDFRHDLCPLVYGVDIGHEISPIDENCSLVSNGFGGRKYLQEILKVKRDEMRASIRDYKPTGNSVLVAYFPLYDLFSFGLFHHIFIIISENWNICVIFSF